MLKGKMSIALFVVCLLATMGVPVKAEVGFTDITGHLYEEQIILLKNEGIVRGVGNQLFKPDELLSNAQALQLYVNVFELSLDRFRFIKEPLATDYFTKADNNAWYAQAFIIASVNGIEADKDLVPTDAITRESFYLLLNNQIENLYDTEATIEEGLTNPKASLTRGEAANAIVLALQFLKSQEDIVMESEPFKTVLNTEVASNEINFLFDIYNETEMDQSITFSSSQTFDFNVYNSKDEQVYNWSSIRSFLMMIVEVDIEKNGYVRYETPWDYKDATGEMLPAGTYKVVFSTRFMFGEEPMDLSSEVFIEIESMDLMN